MGKIVVLTQRGIKISEQQVDRELSIGRAPNNDIQIKQSLTRASRTLNSQRECKPR